MAKGEAGSPKKPEASKPEAPKHIPAPCAKCGKDMRAPDGIAYIGKSLKLNINEKTLLDFFKKQFGKYDIEKNIDICWECFIDAYMYPQK